MTSVMGLCGAGERKRGRGLRTKQMSVIPKTKESAKQLSQCDACFNRENGDSVA